MNRRVATQLVLPLVAAAVLSGLVHLRWPADGFFLNLAAGFVGSLVTVGYIDGIIRRHEKEAWRGADSQIQARLSKLASSTITGIRTSFGYGTEVFDRVIMAVGDPEAMRNEVMRVATHVLAPAARANVAALNQEQWQSFGTHLQHCSVECGILLDRFGHRLGPTDSETLLRLQEHLDSAQTYWRVFPDLAGVQASQVKSLSMETEDMQAAWCELAAKDVRRVLELSTAIASRFGSQALASTQSS